MQVGWVSAVQDRRVASFRYRVEAPAGGLRDRGHKVEVLDPAQADRYDVVVFSKAYSAEHRAFARSVKRRGGRVVFDICDNHFYNPFDLPKYRLARDEIGEMMSIADRVICSTPALAKVIREETGDTFEPIVVGDVVERHPPRSRVSRAEGGRSQDAPLRLTWFGSHGSPNAPSGMTDLLLIREQLEALAARRPVELTVCSNSREKFDQSIAPMRLETRYEDWSLESFSSVLERTDAAILPMNINPFTACKTHNRLTTALYAGVPVIAAEIESYREFGRFCTLNDWDSGFEALLEGSEEERQRALSSRRYIDERWSIETLAAQWEAALALPAATERLQDVHLHGRLDAVARQSVTGWVRAPLNPETPLQVVLECDGEPVSIARAELPRDDLRAVGLEQDCGFSLPLPSALAHTDGSRLSVRVLDSDWVVGANPILMRDEGPRCGQPIASVTETPRLPREQRWDVEASLVAQERAFDRLGAEISAAKASRAPGKKLRAAASARAELSARDVILAGLDARNQSR